MTMYLIDLLIITFIIIFILDLTGIIDDIERGLQKRLMRKVRIKKPWSCSLCMTFWIGLIYLLLTGHFTIPAIGYVSLLSFLTPVMKDLLISIRELLNYLVCLCDRWINE